MKTKRLHCAVAAIGISALAAWFAAFPVRAGELPTPDESASLFVGAEADMIELLFTKNLCCRITWSLIRLLCSTWGQGDAIAMLQAIVPEFDMDSEDGERP